MPLKGKKKRLTDSGFPTVLQEAVIQGCILNVKEIHHKFQQTLGECCNAFWWGTERQRGKEKNHSIPETLWQNVRRLLGRNPKKRRKSAAEAALLVHNAALTSGSTKKEGSRTNELFKKI